MMTDLACSVFADLKGASALEAPHPALTDLDEAFIGTSEGNLLRLDLANDPPTLEMEEADLNPITALTRGRMVDELFVGTSSGAQRFDFSGDLMEPIGLPEDPDATDMPPPPGIVAMGFSVSEAMGVSDLDLLWVLQDNNMVLVYSVASDLLAPAIGDVFMSCALDKSAPAFEVADLALSPVTGAAYVLANEGGKAGVCEVVLSGGDGTSSGGSEVDLQFDLLPLPLGQDDTILIDGATNGPERLYVTGTSSCPFGTCPIRGSFWSYDVTESPVVSDAMDVFVDGNNQISLSDDILAMAASPDGCHLYVVDSAGKPSTFRQGSFFDLEGEGQVVCLSDKGLNLRVELFSELSGESLRPLGAQLRPRSSEALMIFEGPDGPIDVLADLSRLCDDDAGSHLQIAAVGDVQIKATLAGGAGEKSETLLSDDGQLVMTLPEGFGCQQLE